MLWLSTEFWPARPIHLTRLKKRSSIWAKKALSGTEHVHLNWKLVKEYNLKLILLEGAYGFVDASALSSHPDENIRKDLAQYFLNRGFV
jgi:hypothetical protein